MKKFSSLLFLVASLAAMSSYGIPKDNDVEGTVVKMLDRDVYVHHQNTDRSRIPSYTLEDPLTFLNGEKVRNAADWERRRQEILGIFAKEMYGAEPPAPETVVTELVDENPRAVAGYAIRRQYRMWFKADKSGPMMSWIVWMPRFAKGPVPVISFLNYRGNHELSLDPDIAVPTAWSRSGLVCTGKKTPEEGRGVMTDHNRDMVFPLGMIIARGYAVMSACYCEVSPDPVQKSWIGPDHPHRQERFAYNGVFSLWGARDPKRTDNITALGAWAWALSRGLDLAERIPEIDAKKAVVTGCSRLGKAALIAAARDVRFAVCVPNQTGGGGVTLAKRDFGENVSTENRTFTHWYCAAYAKYAKDPHKTLTFDQHLFVACVAPRALLVEGFDNDWYDPEGEYLSLKAASPVWELLRGEGLPKGGYPDDFDTSAVGTWLGYVHRNQNHGISAYDWMWTLDFADRVFNQKTDPHSDLFSTVKAREVAVRKGLGHFFAKCVPGATVRVAYFGGSITEADGWKTFTFEWLKQEYPQTKFELIDAALGGTGSDYGAYRLEKDVLPKKPDLMFVEFSLNDGSKDCRRYIEGIVRNYYAALPESDIAFVYVVGRPTGPLLQKGFVSIGAARFEEIAEHYGIPSMSMGVKAAEMANRGELVWTKGERQIVALAGKETEKDRPDDDKGPIVFLQDGAHPYRETGHRLYAEAVERGLAEIRKAGLEPTDHTKLPGCARPDCLGPVRFYTPETAVAAGLELKGGNWRNDLKVQTSWWNNPPSFYKFYNSCWRCGGDAEIRFRFKGASVLFAGVRGPGTGAAEVIVDGVKREVEFFDMYCAFWRLAPYQLASDLDPAVVHEIVIRNRPGVCNRDQIMREKGRVKQYEAHRDDFEVPEDLMFCGLFVEGEIVK